MSQTSVSAARTPDEYPMVACKALEQLVEYLLTEIQDYIQNLLEPKSLENNEPQHLIYCTHCTRGEWTVQAKSTTSTLHLRHLRRHDLLATSQ